MESLNAHGRHGIVVDHVAHFLPDMEAGSTALSRLGFALTPFSAQSHRIEPGAPLTPAGTANRCVMMRDGYMELLTPTHDTANAGQLRKAIARYTGAHLIAFGSPNPDADYARLEAEGFAPLPPVALQRQVDLQHGEATARFSVVRVAPATMPEGRVQYCRHHTPEVVWQPRWLEHPNHAVGLAGVLLCVADPEQASRRYARFSGLPVQQSAGLWRLDSDRGYLLFMQASTMRALLGVSAPTLPWIAGYVINSDNMAATRTLLGDQVREIPDGRICAVLPDALGGIMLFQQAGSKPLQAS